MNHSLLTRFKMLKKEDFLGVFKFILSLFLIPFYYFKEKDLWLICESENEARDNGYWLFKYICENHPEINVIYAINKKSVDFQKVKHLGRICQYNSISQLKQSIEMTEANI